MKYKVFGLLGKSLKHSFSKKYFEYKFSHDKDLENHQYLNFDLQSLDEFEVLMNTPNLVGFNVTSPYKEEILPFLDNISSVASTIGAVNTVVVEDYHLSGYNTDVMGFDQSLGDRMFKNALILGTGGASKAVSFVLKSRFVPYTFVSRNKTDHGMTYEELAEFGLKNFDLIVNTTPLGMFPNIMKCPNISFSQLTNEHFLYDLVYNPKKSLFLDLGEQNGAQIKNGIEMLELQAEAAWEIWNKR